MKHLSALAALALVVHVTGCGNPKKVKGDADEDAELDATDVLDGTDARDVDTDTETDGPVCGNGIVEGDEECDRGEDNSDTRPDACRTDCVMAHCGDGVKDTGEGCDDGNDVDDDACRNDCALPTCGDGVVDEGEDCDDDNDVDTDDCLSTCVDASCGDGHVWAGHEECDDRNDVDGDGCDTCSFSCHDAEDCGDDNVCTDDACIAGGTGQICDNPYNTAPCNDSDPCTHTDTCDGSGTCSGTSYSCTPGECEATSTCDGAGGCTITHSSPGTTCNDMDPCTHTDECDVSGGCAGTGYTCTPGTCETASACDGSGGCTPTYASPGTACDDGVLCNIDDECDGAGTCAGTDVGLTDCSGTCVDLLTDPDHCGTCTTTCTIDERCAGGSCVARTWIAVGTGPANPGANAAAGHAIGNDGSLPHVVVAEVYSSMQHDVIVRRYVDPNWVAVGTSMVPSARNAARVVDIAFDGTTPHVIYHTGGTHARVEYFSAGAWHEIGTPGFHTLCMGLESLDLALDSSSHPHLTYFGAGGCGLGVGYAWHDGSTWRHHPSVAWTGTELITMNGSGLSDIIFTDRAYVALADSSVHNLKIWDPSGGAWANHGSALDMNGAAGWQEASYVTANASGTLYVAWSEEDTPGGNGEIFVKRWSSTDWTLVGAGKLSGAGDARNPAIAIADGMPYVTWQETTGGGAIHVFVKRFISGAWAALGGALNNDATHDALEPDITAIGREVHVAYREDDGTGTVKVFVRSY